MPMLAEAEQSAPPAIVVGESFVAAAWIGSDARGVHHDARLLTADGLSEIVTLPLPPRQPHSQTLLPGLIGTLHLLWLDMNEQGESRLYTALLTLPDLSVRRGPTPVSERHTLRYTTRAEASGGIVAAWSGGNVAEPSMTLRRVDSDGRPLDIIGRLTAADYPALMVIDGRLHLFWQGVRDAAIYRAEVRENALGSAERLTTSPNLDTGDQLLSLYAGSDYEYQYVIWNISRSNGRCETWMAAGTGSDTWNSPMPLSVGDAGTNRFQSGFNSSVAQQAQSGSSDACLGMPLPEQGPSLPLAAQTSTGLAILYFRSGQLERQQLIARGATLLAPPNFASDRSQHLFLAWSEPSAAGYAELRLVRSN